MKTRYTTVYNTAIPFTKAHQLDPGWILHQLSKCVNVLTQYFHEFMEPYGVRGEL